jgi:hypothetical protein
MVLHFPGTTTLERARMTSRSIRMIQAAATLLMLGALPSPAAGDPPAPAAEAGESWEVSSQMSMEGMPMLMPAQTQRVCVSKDWKEPPGGSRGDCQSSGFKTTGNKSTWRAQCSGPPAMTGEGEITRTSADAYSGLIRFSSAEGTMTLKLSGRRVGACRLGQ